MGGGPDSRKMWLFDQKNNTSDLAFFKSDKLVGRTSPQILSSEIPSDEGNLQILIAGDLLFRVVGTNNYNTGKIYMYDARTGIQNLVEKTADGQTWYEPFSIDLPFKVGQGSESAAFRPELSFNPFEKMLYLVAPQSGKLYRISIESGIFSEIPIPQGNGVSYGASDVEVDTRKNVLYVVARGFAGAWNDSASVNGKIFEFPLGSAAALRSVRVGVNPWQIAVGLVGGVTNLFVTNNADSFDQTDTVSRVETVSFTEVLPRFVTLEQPTGIVVQLK
jgi:hypothetical protein